MLIFVLSFQYVVTIVLLADDSNMIRMRALIGGDSPFRSCIICVSTLPFTPVNHWGFFILKNKLDK